MFTAIFLALSSHLIALSVSTEQSGYLAPATYLDLLGDGPNGYTVNFHANHSLEQHFQFIGRDLSDLHAFERHTLGYFALVDNKLRDEKIRRDPGVCWIETDLEMLDLIMYDSQEDLYKQASIGRNPALYINLDPVWREHSTRPPLGNLA